jgi:hypothetical protein
MAPFVGIFALFVFGGLATYTICERRHRARWWRSDRRPIEQTGSPFRRAHGPAPTREVLIQQRAPKLIRRTALWSIYMGQMAVPGALLGLVGLIYGGLGLISIPGLILAIRIWRLGYAMLRRDYDTEHEARALYRFAVWLNVVALALVGATTLLLGPLFVPVAFVFVIYGLLSFGHALALRDCADALAEDRRLRDATARVAEREAWLQPTAVGY